MRNLNMTGNSALTKYLDVETRNGMVQWMDRRYLRALREPLFELLHTGGQILALFYFNLGVLADFPDLRGVERVGYRGME